MEELEKVRLKKQIAEFKKQRTARHVFGLNRQVKSVKQAQRRKIYLGSACRIKGGRI